MEQLLTAAIIKPAPWFHTHVARWSTNSRNTTASWKSASETVWRSRGRLRSEAVASSPSMSIPETDRERQHKRSETRRSTVDSRPAGRCAGARRSSERERNRSPPTQTAASRSMRCTRVTSRPNSSVRQSPSPTVSTLPAYSPPSGLRNRSSRSGVASSREPRCTLRGTAGAGSGRPAPSEARGREPADSARIRTFFPTPAGVRVCRSTQSSSTSTGCWST